MSLRRIVCLAPLGMFVLATASAQMPGASVHQSEAKAKLRPIGSPGLVDRLRQTPVPQGYGASQQQRFSSTDQQAVAKPVIQQTAMMQATGGMGLPPLGAPPPATAQPAVAQPPAATMPTGPSTPMPGAPSSRPVPPSLAGQGLQPVPLDNQALPNNQAFPNNQALPTAPQGVPSGSDLTPVPQPGLSQNMATVDNCACVSAPSSYNAGGMWDCGPAYVVPTSVTVPASVPYAPPPAVIAQPVASPAVVPTAMVPTAGCKPLFTLGQDPYNVQLGQGIIGQPKAYVPGQSVRNFIRYFTP